MSRLGGLLEQDPPDPSLEDEPADVLETDMGILFGVTHDTPFSINEDQLRTAKRLASRGIWYEGTAPEPIIRGFIEDQFPGLKSETWEPPRLNDEENKKAELIRDLFGPEFEGVRDVIIHEPSFDPDATVLDNILGTYGVEDPELFTDRRIQDLAQEGSRDEVALQTDPRVSRLPKMLDDPWGHGHEGFRAVHGIVNSLVWAWSNGGGGEWNYFAKLFAKQDLRRELHLAELMTTEGGVFFAGRSHNENVGRILG